MLRRGLRGGRRAPPADSEERRSRMSDEASKATTDDAVVAWPTVLEESFAVGGKGWSFAATAKTPPERYDAPGLQMTLPGGETSVAAFWYEGKLFSDFALSVTISVLAAQEPTQSYAGVSFRAQSDRDNYRLFLDGEGFYRLTRRVQNQSHGLVDWTRHEAIKPGLGQENRVTIVAKGTRITVSCNGEELVSLDDDVFEKGHIALQAQGGSPEIESATVFCFKNLELSEP